MAPQKNNILSFFIASPCAFVRARRNCNYARRMWIKTIRSQENEISQSAYEAIRKQSNFAAPITANLRPSLQE
jgi:hypothetical protein